MRTNNLAIAIIMFVLMALPATPSRSQIIINEIIQNPEFVGDTEGEWFELYNQGSSDVDINGWTILDNGTNNHIIDNGGPLMVSPGGYLVLGRNADSTLNGNVPVGYAYGTDITLGNSSDQIILEDQNGVEIDRVEYDDGASFPDPTGASMELISPSLDNNVGLHWAESITSWNGNDRGTPGALNSVTDAEPPELASASAPTATTVDVVFNESVERESAEEVTNYSINNGIGPPVSASQDSVNLSLVHLTVSTLTSGVTYTLLVTGIRDLTGNTMEEDSVDFVLVRSPEAGDIVITEIMSDPDGINDSNGEWFEVYNPTELPIDMNGWRVSDDGSNAFTISGSFVVPAGNFAVFTVNTDSATNGGFDFERMYDWGSSSTFTLGNTDDEIVIKNGATIIDSVRYDTGAGWPDTTGASIGLTNFTFDNNAGSNWTIAHLREPAYVGSTGNLGSPGTLGANQNPGTAATIQVTPDSLTFHMGSDDRYALDLTISNIGGIDLLWSTSDSIACDDCPWLSVKPPSGIVPPGGSSTISVFVEAEGLSSGMHQCTVYTSSNDPVNPISSTPVTLNVLDTTIVGAVTIPPEFLPIPAAGDTVPMHVDLENLAGVKKTTEVWINLLLPGTTEPRLILGPKQSSLAEFQTEERERSLIIPGRRPSGIYELQINIGTYPTSVEYTGTFAFEKSPINFQRIETNPEGDAEIPDESFLAQGYPNPFNSTTVLQYGLKHDEWVTLKIYNLIGQELATLVNEFQAAGRRSIHWNGINNVGRELGSGVYVYRLSAGSFAKSGKVILIK